MCLTDLSVRLYKVRHQVLLVIGLVRDEAVAVKRSLHWLSLSYRVWFYHVLVLLSAKFNIDSSQSFTLASMGRAERDVGQKVADLVEPDLETDCGRASVVVNN